MHKIVQVDVALTTILTIKVHSVDVLLDTMIIALQDHLVTEEVAIVHQVKTHLVTMALEMMVLDVVVTSLEAVQHAVKAGSSSNFGGNNNPSGATGFGGNSPSRR